MFHRKYQIKQHDPTFVNGKKLKHIREDAYTGYHIYF